MVADTNCMFAKGVTACSSWYGVMTANTHDVHQARGVRARTAEPDGPRS